MIVECTKLVLLLELADVITNASKMSRLGRARDEVVGAIGLKIAIEGEMT